MKLPEDDTRATRILLTFQGQRALEELINTFGGLTFSLNMDHIPDSQPTSQELMTMTLRERQANEETIKKEREEHRSQTEKQNEAAEALKMQLSKLNKDLQHSQAKCEETEKVHEGRWQRLQQMIGLKGSGSRNARSQKPELLTSEQSLWYCRKSHNRRIHPR
ncbi:uncharacterized protein LOC124271777 [Haliotis rubra]|uniref:uncharacterized protein LOC124271777 n=1 Tax=Haliotis rubra TaxID=36100 RepID=UPI001EE5B135|nr:uncharacterized protein LOC124271777 [Haliotis rubra]